MALFSKENFSKENLKKFASDAREVIKKRWWVMLIELVALALLLVADLLTKEYAVRFLLAQPAGYEYKLIPGVIHLTYSENTGAGFGVLSENTTLLIVVTFFVIIGVTLFLIFAQKQNEWLRASLLLIVGGGIGNLVDRLGLGYVRDFIDYAFLKDFAICNVADLFVTVGAVMLVIVLIVMLVKEGRKNQKEFEKEQEGKAPEQGTDPLDAPINLNPMLSSPNDYTFEEGSAQETAEHNTDDTPETTQNTNESATAQYSSEAKEISQTAETSSKEDERAGEDK